MGLTKEDLKYIEDNFLYQTDSQLGEKFGIPYWKVQKKRLEMGLNRHKYNKMIWTKERTNYLKKNYGRLDIETLSLDLNLRPVQVENKIISMGLPEKLKEQKKKDNTRKKTETRYKTAWNQKEIESVYKLYEDGKSIKDITKRFQTIESDIKDIIRSQNEIKNLRAINSNEYIINKFGLEISGIYKFIDNNGHGSKITGEYTIIDFYDNFFMATDKNNIKSSFNYMDLVTGDYKIKKVGGN